MELLKSIVEQSNIVDFQQALNAKQGRVAKRKQNDYHAADLQAATEYNAVEHDLARLYKNARVPGFPTFEDLAYFLAVVSSASMMEPNEVRPEYHEKLQMIAHHAPRIIALLSQATQIVHNFMTRWAPIKDEFGADVSAMDDATFLDQQLNADINSLEHLVRARRKGQL